jgi:hypothetical protein
VTPIPETTALRSGFDENWCVSLVVVEGTAVITRHSLPNDGAGRESNAHFGPHLSEDPNQGLLVKL